MPITVVQGFGGNGTHGSGNVVPDLLYFSDDIVPDDIHAPILAPEDGTVVWVQNSFLPGDSGPSGFGNLVTVRYDGLGADDPNTPQKESFYVTYAHLDGSNIAVHRGDTVHAGQTIGFIGDAGYSLHLHIQFGVVPMTTGGSQDKIADASFATSQKYWMPAVFLGNASDILKGSLESDYYMGGDGNDKISGGQSTDIFSGGAGTDSLTGGDGNDLLFPGDAHPDAVHETIWWFTLSHDGARDKIDGGDGIDQVAFGMLGETKDIIFDNSVPGSNQVMIGGVATLTITNVEQVYMYSGSGNDTLTGGDDWDDFHGSGGRDRLLGGGGSDTLFGDAQNDNLYGGGGGDWLYGGLGTDTLSGGRNADMFVFSGETGLDGIRDFNRAQGDKIVIEVQGVDEFSDLTISDATDGNALVSWSGPNSPGAVLYGITASQIVEGDFIFLAPPSSARETDHTFASATLGSPQFGGQTLIREEPTPWRGDSLGFHSGMSNGGSLIDIV